MPASIASSPNEALKSSGASASGNPARTPSRMRELSIVSTLAREAVGAAGAAPTGLRLSRAA